MTRSLANLRRARVRIHRQLDKLEPLLAAYRFKLSQPVQCSVVSGPTIVNSSQSIPQCGHSHSIHRSALAIVTHGRPSSSPWRAIM
jgi:hypothetical protein